MELVEGKNSRYCLTCDKLKHFDNFGKDKRGKYGYRSKCKGCRSEYKKEYTNKKKTGIFQKEKKREILGDIINLLRKKKYCFKCCKYKSFNKFSKHENCKYGLNTTCKKCIRENSREWYENNREYVLKQQKRDREQNPEKYRKRDKKWRENNPDYQSNYYQENKENWKEYRKKYYKNNKEKIFEAKRKKHNKRYKNDIEFRLKRIIRTRINKAIQRDYKKSKSIELLGCTVGELKEYLEKQFEDGMNWDNYGKGGWEVDHIIPCSYYDLTKPHHQEECFFYTNLQPLWKEDNLKKSDKLIYA